MVRSEGNGGSPLYERSSIGRAPVSKTGGWGFDSLRSCSASGRGVALAGRIPREKRSGAMGKVKDGSPASSKAAKLSKGGPTGDSKRRFAPFLANLVQTGVYKPLQGRQARLWTAIGLGAIIVFGLREVFLTLQATSSSVTAYSITAAI